MNQEKLSEWGLMCKYILKPEGMCTATDCNSTTTEREREREREKGRERERKRARERERKVKASFRNSRAKELRLEKWRVSD